MESIYANERASRIAGRLGAPAPTSAPILHLASSRVPPKPSQSDRIRTNQQQSTWARRPKQSSKPFGSDRFKMSTLALLDRAAAPAPAPTPTPTPTPILTPTSAPATATIAAESTISINEKLSISRNGRQLSKQRLTEQSRRLTTRMRTSRSDTSGDIFLFAELATDNSGKECRQLSKMRLHESQNQLFNENTSSSNNKQQIDLHNQTRTSSSNHSKLPSCSCSRSSLSASAAASACSSWSPPLLLVPLIEARPLHSAPKLFNFILISLIVSIVLHNSPWPSAVAGAQSTSTASLEDDRQAISSLLSEFSAYNHRGPRPRLSLMSGDNGQKQTTAQLETNGNKYKEANNNNNSLDRPAQHRNQQVGASPVPMVPECVACLERGQQQRRQRRLAVDLEHKHQQQAPDCRKLSALWIFLQATYPALSRHLLDWATSAGGQQSDERFLWAKSSQLARSMGRLLDELERLVELQQDPQLAPAAGRQATWLARVSSSPAYAKLVQHLRAKQQQQQRQAERGASKPVERSKPPSAGAGSSSSPVPAGTGLQHVYGTVIRYPHEVANIDNSPGMVRTLEKLHLLDQLGKQGQTIGNEIERLQLGNENSEAEQVESNRIPTEIDQQSDWRKSLELADAARSKVVYGNVLLRPVAQKANSNSDQHQSSMETLRDLANQARSLEDGASQEQQANNRDSNQLDHDQHHRHRHDNVEYYHDQQYRHNHNQNNDNNDNKQPENNSNEVKGKTSTLSRLKQKLDLNQFDSPPINEQQQPPLTVASGGGPMQMGTDELASQQRAHQVAISSEETDDGFEGEFHSGPLRQAEVRQLRSLHLSSNNMRANDNHNKKQIVILTTNNPRDAFVLD